MHSYVTDDKIYCIYFSPKEDLIRAHARQLGIPADRVSAVRGMLDPDDYRGAAPAAAGRVASSA